MERSGRSQAEPEFLDDLRNDDADRIGGHCKHHEHQERQAADESDILSRRAVHGLASRLKGGEPQFIAPALSRGEFPAFGMLY
jgi:hypothetical protein